MSTSTRRTAQGARAGSAGDFFAAGVSVGQGVGIVRFRIGAGVVPGGVLFDPGVFVVFTVAGVPVSVVAVVVPVGVVVVPVVAVVVTVVAAVVTGVVSEESAVSGATKWTVLPSRIVTLASYS